MLDADYAMKRVMMGRQPVPIAGYRTLPDLLQAGEHLSSRFWLYPVRFNARDIRSSRTGDIALFSTRLRVLTEQMVLSADGLSGAGATEPGAERAAEQFATHYKEIADDLARHGDTSMKQLDGLLDLVTVCSLWRLARGLGLLDELVQVKPGSAGPPRVYPGLQVAITGPDGNIVGGIAGGVQMRRSVGDRLVDRYEDAQTRKLRSATAQLESSRAVSVNVPGLQLLLVQSEPGGQDHTELLFADGVRRLAEDQPSEAAAAFSEVLRVDPEFFEALALRATAYLRQKQYAAARRDLDAAAAMAPSDPKIHAARLWAALESGNNVDMDAFSADVRLRVRDVYWRLGERQLVVKDFPAAAASFTTALRCDPDTAHFELLLRRAYVEELGGKLDDAERDYHALREALRGKQVFSDPGGLNPWAALRESLESTDLALGMCRVEVDQQRAYPQRCQQILSEDSECKWPSISADRPTAFEATYYWSVGKAQCLLDLREAKIVNGTFDRNFSQFEVRTLEATVKQLDSVLDDVPSELQTSIGSRFGEARQLREALRARIQQINASELHP